MLCKICHELQLHMKAASDHSLIFQQEFIGIRQTLKLIISAESAQGGHNLSCKIRSEEHVCAHGV